MALSGTSGSGKSMLLRCIAGLEHDASGECLLNGQKSPEKDWAMYRRKVLLVSQRPVLLDGTVLESLSLPFTYQSSERGFPLSEAESYMEQLGLKGLMDHKTRTLSVGEKQRICFLRALLLKPDFLLLDEPTSALDEENTALVEGLIRESVEEKGLGCLLVSHDKGQLGRLSNRQIALISTQ